MMAGENQPSEPEPTRQLDEPEFFHDESVPQNTGIFLAHLIRFVAVSMIRWVIVGCFQAPINRLFLLESVQGKLIQNGRLLNGGFGGIRSCIRRIITKEGVLGLFRGCLVDMQLAVPNYIVQVWAAVSVLWVQRRLALTPWWPAGVAMGVAAPGLRVLLSSPIVGYKNSIFCNYVADIVAPKKVDVRGGEDVEEAYLYNSPWEAAADVKNRYGWKGICFNGVDVDIAAAYAENFLVQFVGVVIMPRLNYLIDSRASQHSRRQAAVMITSVISVRFFCLFVLHPFQVIRAHTTLLTRERCVNDKTRHWFWHHAWEIVQRDGITALWAGYRVRCLRELCGILLGAIISR